jgi:hypothetical protein
MPRITLLESLTPAKIHQLHHINQLCIKSNYVFWPVNSLAHDTILAHMHSHLTLYSMGRRAKYVTVSEQKSAWATANAQFYSTAR